MGIYGKRETRKPKTAADKGKRYRCCVCHKRAARKTTVVPYYCDRCVGKSRSVHQGQRSDDNADPS